MDNGGLSESDSRWLSEQSRDKHDEFMDKKVSMLINQVEEYKKIVDGLKKNQSVQKAKIDEVINGIKNRTIGRYDIVKMLEDLK